MPGAGDFRYFSCIIIYNFCYKTLITVVYKQYALHSFLHCIQFVSCFLYREPTPSYSALDVSLPPSEEVQHLRRQVGKLNRRVMALELELMHRQQKEKILYIATVAYLILKAFSWLSRN